VSFLALLFHRLTAARFPITVIMQNSLRRAGCPASLRYPLRGYGFLVSARIAAAVWSVAFRFRCSGGRFRGRLRRPLDGGYRRPPSFFYFDFFCVFMFSLYFYVLS